MQRFIVAVLLLTACAAPPPKATQPALATATPAPPSTPTNTPLPSPTATPALLPLQIVEWNEYPYTNLADPANTDTHVEVLIHNPNNVPIRIDQNAGELRFINAAGETVYANPNPVFYIWQGEWMLPDETAALSACVCFNSSGLESQEWETLELVMPLELATDLAYTPDVELSIGEIVDIAAAHLGGSGFGVRLNLANTSDQVLESIAMRVQVYDAEGRYLGTIGYGNAVVSFTDDVGIQPGDTGTGIEVIEIEYYDAYRMTFEPHALGILWQEPTPAPTLSAALEVWEGIPIMPAALGGMEADGSYQYTTLAPLEEIRAFYESELAALGYTLESVDDGGAEYMLLNFTNGSKTLQVGIASVGGFNAVVLLLN